MGSEAGLHVTTLEPAAKDWTYEKCDCSNLQRRNESFRCSAPKSVYKVAVLSRSNSRLELVNRSESHVSASQQCCLSWLKFANGWLLFRAER